MNITKTIDTSGLRCPLPILKAKKAIKSLACGDRLQVIATDPAAVSDFDLFCKMAGHRFILQKQAQENNIEVFYFVIEVQLPPFT
jgi:tRNA 2-thiouridine synthesizing protein A